MISPISLTLPIHLNSPVAPSRVTFASQGVSATWSVPARCPRRLKRYRSQFKRTLLLFCKDKFEVGASYHLVPWQTPNPARAVVDTGAGPSVVRSDIITAGRIPIQKVFRWALEVVSSLFGC